MIHGVYANKASFHSVEFTTGLNMVVADRSAVSTEKDTRNGLGKSALIEIIDFCLGSSATSGKGLCIEPLADWAFTLDLTLAGNRVRITRSIAAPNRIVIDGETTAWIEQPDSDHQSGEKVFNLDRWKNVLGWTLFDLPRSIDTQKYKPSYRSLVSYFVRRGIDAYADPFRHFRQQKTWDIQVNTAYLLGLNWEYGSQWQVLKDREEALKALAQSIATGAMEGIVGSVGELEAERIQLETQVEEERVALESFKVHPQYERIQIEADQATANIHNLTNKNVSDRRRLARYGEAVTEEKPPEVSSIEALYQETGLVFPDAVKRTLAEAKEFHAQIIRNRKAFLEAEIERLENTIKEREDEIRALTESRAQTLVILRTHGALQEMTALQDRHARTVSNLQRAKNQISTLKDINTQRRDLKTSKSNLVKVAERDHEQRRELWSTAVRVFNDNSQALYKAPGRLAIDIDETGFKYSIDIQRSGSEGIAKMKVFCFDLMLLQILSSRDRAIDFLIHDSLMYDGVDSRQTALALERANTITSSLGGQYICAMNSDMIPMSEFSDDFDFETHVRLKLTDDDPSGSLLGIRFERPSK